MFLDIKTTKSTKSLPGSINIPHNESQGNLVLEIGHSEIPLTPPPTPTSSRTYSNLVRWPLLGIPSSGGNYISRRVSVRSDRNRGELNAVNATDPVNNNAADKNLREPQTNFGLDFGWLFGWLERAIWFTMIVGIVLALLLDFSKATSEFCMREGKEYIPFNVLPSLSRSMTFQVGKFLWTIMMASVFVARLLSNHFLHKLYKSWFTDTVLNKIILIIAYSLDTVEIVSLIMICAFPLDYDSKEHSLFFQVFIWFTYAAELCQYLTKFLEKKKNFPEDPENVNNYYKQIGVLIILQTVFIVFMMIGYCLHSYLCEDYYYTVFALGEYITVIINVRFKRDTVLFVK